MKTIDIINIIAIICSPIIAVVVGQMLQTRAKKRQDKMDVFMTLMISRGMGWSYESVKALNIIEVVFGDDDKVLNQWRIYYDKLCVENPSETELSKIKTEADKLLDVISKSLGYKEKVTWETIQKPYIPKGLLDEFSQRKQYESAQLGLMNFASAYAQQMKMNGANKDSNVLKK